MTSEPIDVRTSPTVIFADNNPRLLPRGGGRGCAILSIRIFLRMNALALEQSKHSLATQVLRSWGTLQLRVQGVSMLPTLWPGDLLTLQSQDYEQTEAGDLVLYVRGGRFFVHRTVRKTATEDETFLITRGDCMAEDDPPVPAADLLGRVTRIERRGLLLEPGWKLSFTRRIFAGLLCRWDLLRNVILRLRTHNVAASAGTDFTSTQSAQ